jgi:hypothetical protein
MSDQQLLHRSIAGVYCKVQVLLGSDLWKAHPRCNRGMHNLGILGDNSFKYQGGMANASIYI